MTGNLSSASALASTPNTFNFESHTVRVVMRDDEPWFVATDVCMALGLPNPSEALRSLDRDERMTLSLTEGHSGQRGGARLRTIINECGMHTLVPRCRVAFNPSTVPYRFRKWVTSIVLQHDDAKEPVVISAGSYRHKRARALTDFARASVQISDLIEAGV
ncbi:BRO-N domain-containing protein [Ralstonia pickettii]|uniref:BRO-N domain-containing protein n=1 Tax=Ralstonia pickettii TaxID=329 RepID=UPI0008188160|nr:BRO family protein [Ralstonia pickettii]OCS47450.1 hypothetical protein BEK67_06575 [Ralstonia pickettii]